MLQIAIPVDNEFAPYYGAYIKSAAARLESETGSETGAVQGLLARQPDELELLPGILAPDKASFAYAEGKWTLTESIIHMSDTERVFAYRLLRIARGDTLPLAGFDQDAWVPQSRARGRTVEGAIAEFRAVRGATLPLIESLDEVSILRKGTASEHPVSVRALVWIIAGHAQHHIRLIAERYLGLGGSR